MSNMETFNTITSQIQKKLNEDSMKAIKEALDRKAENARELGLNYEPQRTWVGLTDEDLANCFTTEEYETARYWETKLKEKNNG